MDGRKRRRKLSNSLKQRLIPDTSYAMNLKYQLRCYDHFRLQWMLSHGFSLTDLVKGLEEYVNEWLGEADPGMHVDCLPDINMEQILENWSRDSGFGGEIWPCFREFMDCEFRECGYAEGKVKEVMTKEKEE